MSLFAHELKVAAVPMVVLGDFKTGDGAAVGNPPEIAVFKTISLFDAGILVQDLLDILKSNGWDIPSLVEDYTQDQ